MLDEVRPYSATPRKREEARRRGHVPHSRDLSVATGLAAGVVTLWVLGPRAAAIIEDMARSGLTNWRVADAGPSAFLAHVEDTAFAGLIVVAPVALASAAATLLAHLVQVGFLLRTPALSLDAWRYGGGPSLGRAFSLDALATALFGAGKLLAVGWAALGGLGALSFGSDGRLMIGSALAVALGRAVAALVALSVVDYLYRYWRFEQQMRMTRAELEAELRETEGHPITRARRRRRRGV